VTRVETPRILTRTGVAGENGSRSWGQKGNSGRQEGGARVSKKGTPTILAAALLCLRRQSQTENRSAVYRWVTLMLVFFAVFQVEIRQVHAQGVSACDAALVKSTYNKFSSDHLDWRLAQYVSEQTYDEIKHDAGVNAVIYGVPVGASYGDFKKHVDDRVNSLRTSLTHDQAINVMWTGLDPNAVTAYSTCLQTVVLSSSGLHMVVRSATARDIALTLRWVPRGTDPRMINLTWSGLRTDIDGKALPHTITQGEQTVIVARPKARQQLAVNSSGLSDVITMEPIPPPPPAPKPFTYTLTAGGYASRCAGRGQVPGTACGTEGVAIYDGASGVPLSFRWDQCWVCQGQGIKGYPANLGTIAFGDGTVATIPEINGIATVTYPFAGSYTVTVKVTATCIDVNKPDNPCGGQASVQINIAP
jgi:hypothetical protein